MRHETPQGEKERAPSTASAASSRAPRARLTTRRNVAFKKSALSHKLPYYMARGRALRLETLDATGREREGTINSLGGLVEGPQGQTHHEWECRVQDTHTVTHAAVNYGKRQEMEARDTRRYRGRKRDTINSLGGLVEGPQCQTHHEWECHVQDTRTVTHAAILHGKREGMGA